MCLKREPAKPKAKISFSISHKGSTRCNPQNRRIRVNSFILNCYLLLEVKSSASIIIMKHWQVPRETKDCSSLLSVIQNSDYKQSLNSLEVNRIKVRTVKLAKIAPKTAVLSPWLWLRFAEPTCSFRDSKTYSKSKWNDSPVVSCLVRAVIKHLKKLRTSQMKHKLKRKQTCNQATVYSQTGGGNMISVIKNRSASIVKQLGLGGGGTERDYCH